MIYFDLKYKKNHIGPIYKGLNLVKLLCNLINPITVNYIQYELHNMDKSYVVCTFIYDNYYINY